MKLWFGKYTGWEIEDVLKVNPKYLEHIFSLKGLCSENPDAYKEFIKLGGKGDDTREHNEMQIKFLLQGLDAHFFAQLARHRH